MSVVESCKGLLLEQVLELLLECSIDTAEDLLRFGNGMSGVAKGQIVGRASRADGRDDSGSGISRRNRCGVEVSSEDVRKYVQKRVWKVEVHDG